MTGAALRTKGGKIFRGCNVENCTYGLTVCAERVAGGQLLEAAAGPDQREVGEVHRRDQQHEQDPAPEQLEGGANVPDDVGLRLQTARLFAQAGDPGHALDQFQQALQLGAGIDTAVEYAELLIHEGRYPEAEKTLNELRSSHANDAAINRGLGRLYKAQGKFDVAAVFLRRAVTEDPQDPVAHYTLAITLQRLNQDAEAKKELELFSAAKEERRFVRALEIASDPVAAREK